MADPVTRPRHGEPLTAEEVQKLRAVMPLPNITLHGKLVVPLTDEEVRDLCDSVDSLRQSLVALRTERDQWYDTCDKAWTACDECATAEPDHSLPAAVEKLRLRAEAAEAQRTEAEQALAGLRGEFEAAVNLVNAVHEPAQPCGRKGQCPTCNTIERWRKMLEVSK